ncbi:hypothetical protein K492DRAFT_207771 [Lichtheimia hyalospora FSU 10163]|nr:hypothetical protein K492DRAFT_207771 [Lichtheimia hyalospora FSU 10163]
MPKQTRCCPCKWTGCHDSFETVEILYDHLCNEHVGRKATHNLCLECRWDDCGAQAAKRDHLASHLLVHLPLKPHQCSTCKKAFKRPQDLKKHEKIHTIEHKASLISKQPGYKAVRRRKHHSQVAKPSFDWYTQATSPSSNKTDTDFSGTSGPSNSGNSSLFIRKQSPISMNPVQDLFQQVVDNTALSPEYNDEMMDRLDYISAAVQHQSNEWIPPVDNPNDLDTLQSWLEQLSANIETDTCLYPDLLTTTATAPPPPSTSSASDKDLYLYSNEYLDTTNTPSPPDWKTIMMTTTDNPLAASVLLNNSQNSHTSPSISSHHQSSSSTSSSPEEPSSTAAATSIGASFWTPACDLPQVDEKKEPIDGPTPSDSVDFSPPVMVYSDKQPVHLFESSSEKTQMTAQTKRHNTMSHEDKRNVIRMLNVLNSPDNGALSSSTTSSKSSSTNTRSLVKKDETSSSVVEEQSASPTFHSTIVTSGTSLKALPVKDTKEDSPYASLLEQLRDLSCDDSDDSSDDIQQRHADTVNYLWDAVMRAKKTIIKTSRSSDTRHGDTQQQQQQQHTTTTLISV